MPRGCVIGEKNCRRRLGKNPTEALFRCRHSIQNTKAAAYRRSVYEAKVKKRFTKFSPRAYSRKHALASAEKRIHLRIVVSLTNPLYPHRSATCFPLFSIDFVRGSSTSSEKKKEEGKRNFRSKIAGKFTASSVKKTTPVSRLYCTKVNLIDRGTQYVVVAVFLFFILGEGCTPLYFVGRINQLDGIFFVYSANLCSC